MSEPEFKILNDYQHARLRTEMYLGSRVPTDILFPVYDELTDSFSMQKVTLVPALLTGFREALDNHLDELTFVGKGIINVFYNEDTGVFQTSDTGRGIPLDYIEEEGARIATIAVSRTKAGRNFGERGEQAGTNGLGISVVNYCSEFFSLVVERDGSRFVQNFVEGEESLIVEEPTISSTDKKKHGTSVSFKLSSKVFEQLILPVSVVKSLVVLIAKTNPNIEFAFNGSVIKRSQDIKKNLFPGEKSVYEFKFEDANARGSYYLKMTDEDLAIFSLVNNIPAYNGGTMDDEVKYHFPRQLLEALTKESKRRKLSPNKNDVLENLLFIGSMKVIAPNFDSQSKTRLTNQNVRYPVVAAFREKTDWQKFIKENSELVERIYERCAARTHQVDKSKTDQDEKRLKKLKIPSLVDSNSRDRKKCVLFITEGESAKGGLIAARNPDIHAVMPLRGKILNVYHKKPAEASASKILEQLCAAIGLVPGKKVNYDNLRYGKIFIMADADNDGQGSICPLVISFFYKFWPELFTGDEAFVNIFSTPLIIAENKKDRRYFYPHNIEEFDSSKFKGWNIRRAKGLGSLQKENFVDHLANPVAVPLVNEPDLPHVLDLLFNGARADDRKLCMAMTVEENMKKIAEHGSNWNPKTHTLDV
ncbi:DNA gyrase subunit B protein [Rhizobium phage RHph_I46]|uniref:DNA topoisomerase 2 n=1 Tax=Rhizobium phage RHph_I1_9 TaxID=2509729 RepID=A0A7S5R9G5_9CAUD|nr:DNA gyrase subunit B protein [Rhizobium phage RHph_I1_9]QIG69710.1 DNA gyrase subunit B protein [Rhizobium phage RHph_I46]QIG70991.1 DNA gyrase subunit B protein [Rhizobium phage RHph_I9]QIG73577.1 DNA gyrase subunit B protein [Rhizobium phage RHph_I1_9]QIG76330.1 DNA gyrase subunit B protein [Rhizobium phage RHph_I34]